ncbi:MAG: hypothetical protein IKX91_00730 [Firmicutes bacterium]|nr:hypothetical protein [Bacillota bacterium]
MKRFPEAITGKMRSKRGASLAMALLLFLVCSVLGAVVLTAGTASAGRIAGLAETDRRYYNVTSAAELLRDTFEGTTVTVERTRTLTETVVTAYTVTEGAGSGNGAETVTPGTPAVTEQLTYGTVINGNEGIQPADSHSSVDGSVISVDDPSRSFLTARAVALLFGKDGSGNAVCNTEAAFVRSISRTTNEEPWTGFTLTHSADGAFSAPAAIDGRYRLNAGGTIEIELTGDGYTLVMTLKPSFTETELTENETASSLDNDPDSKNYTETVTTTETVTKLSTVKWTCETIR